MRFGVADFAMDGLENILDGIKRVAQEEMKEMTMERDIMTSTEMEAEMEAEMAKDVATLDAVECMVCHALHRADANTFFTFYGNVCVGLGGGLIGGLVATASIFCKKAACMNVILKEITDMPKVIR